jgi:creatinine amidohydrolase
MLPQSPGLRFKMRRMTIANTHAWLRWADLSTVDFAELPLERAVAVLPLGATEQHGPHLPLSVDSDLVDGVIARASAAWDGNFPVLTLPTQTVGFSPEHGKFAGTLTLSSTTLIRLWTEIAEAVDASGVHKLLLLNAHGGQVGALDLVARDLRHRLGMLVVSSSWFQLPLSPQALAPFDAHEQRFGVHAGQMETAMMLALSPERVEMSRAQHFVSSSEQRARACPVLGNGRSAKLAWQAQDLHPSGAVGDAAGACAADGACVLESAAASLCQLIKDIGQLPADTLND